ncbi:MAG TPA: CAP domain-containing protein [Candidatus Paceibacterota bacterium]
MNRRKILLALLILLCIGVIAVALLLNPFRGLKMLASVADATDVNTPDATAAVAAVAFSDQSVTNTVTPKASPATDTSTSAVIAIESTSQPETRLPDLVVGTIVTDETVKKKVSYEYDTILLTNTIHRYTNELRKQEGLPPLSLNATLGQLALERSIDMTDNGTFSHTSTDGCDLDCRFKRTEFATLSWGENIAEYEPYSRFAPEVLARQFVDRWAASSGHRRNLLSSNFSHEGIGVAMNGNRLVVTVIFAQPE